MRRSSPRGGGPPPRGGAEGGPPPTPHPPPLGEPGAAHDAGHLVFDGSVAGPTAFDKAAVRASMDSSELLIRLDLGLGTGVGEGFGCDLTEEYVRENSEYTT